MRFLRSLADFFLLWPFCVVIMYLIHMLPAWLLAWIFILTFGAKSWTVLISTAFKSILSQPRCSLEPKKFFRGVCPLNPLLRGPEHPVLLTLATLVFLMIMFAPGIMSVFYLMFPAGFYDIHPGHNKTAQD